MQSFLCGFISHMETIAQLLKNEKDPEVLRKISLFILEQSVELASENTRLREKKSREEAANKKQEYL